MKIKCVKCGFINEVDVATGAAKELGRRGGKETFDKHGVSWMKHISHLGVEARKKKGAK